jgi:hypothetical protein
LHSPVCVHGLDSYRSTPEGDTLDPIRAERGQQTWGLVLRPGAFILIVGA